MKKTPKYIQFTLDVDGIEEKYNKVAHCKSFQQLDKATEDEAEYIWVSDDDLGISFNSEISNLCTHFKRAGLFYNVGDALQIFGTPIVLGTLLYEKIVTDKTGNSYKTSAAFNALRFSANWRNKTPKRAYECISLEVGQGYFYKKFSQYRKDS